MLKALAARGLTAESVYLATALLLKSELNETYKLRYLLTIREIFLWNF